MRDCSGCPYISDCERIDPCMAKIWIWAQWIPFLGLFALLLSSVTGRPLVTLLSVWVPYQLILSYLLILLIIFVLV